MLTMNKTEAIRAIHFFRGLTDPEMERIAALCKEQSLEARESYLEEYKSDNTVHLILEGKIAAIVHIPNVTQVKNEIVVDVLREGDVYGWPFLLKSSPISNLRVLEPAKLLNINAQELLDICETDHHIGFIVMRNLSNLITIKLKRQRMSMLNAMVAMRGEY
jgi:CRP/FNR family cyclic AMP-dependent transcriptional regulator